MRIAIPALLLTQRSCLHNYRVSQKNPSFRGWSSEIFRQCVLVAQSNISARHSFVEPGDNLIDAQYVKDKEN